MITIEETHYDQIVKALVKLRTIQNYGIIMEGKLTEDESFQHCMALCDAKEELENVIEDVLMEEYPDDERLQCIPLYYKIREAYVPEL